MTAHSRDGASDAVRFMLDGQAVEARGLPCTMTVLEYLRDVAHRTGTKEGCAEGDCGACTVVLGTLAEAGDHIAYRAVNSCVRFLPTIDGQELVTVESLRAPDGSLHPVQQALVDLHGSQCGFCTPGFVMSLFALYLSEPSPGREQVLEALSGNLCRCTGYRPIIAAGCAMATYPAPSHWGREAPAEDGRCDALRRLRRRRWNDSLRLPGFQAPRSLDALAAAIAKEPDALVLAGGTDVGLWVTKQLRELPPIIYVGEVGELRTVRRVADGLVIGAAVTLTDAWAALVAAFPALAEQAQRFGSPPVRNSGTLCGNLANGSPIGDSIPVLIALGAELELRRADTTRRLPLERFYLGYQRKDLGRGEFVVSVTIPPPRPHGHFASYKIAKRFDQDISALSGAFLVELERDRVVAARLAFGGLAAVAARAPATERALIGAAWTKSAVERAAARLADDFQPLTDWRASAAYRLETAANLLRRFHAEHGGQGGATRTADAVAELGAATSGGAVAGAASGGAA